MTPDCLVDFIHIGYHKTGTSFLQSHGLKDHPKIKLLTTDDDLDLRRRINESLNSLCRANALDFDPISYQALFREEFGKVIDAYRDEGYTLGLSKEKFSGDMYTGWNSAQVCDWMAEVFGRPRILIVIRNPFDIILSVYSQYVHEGGVYGLKRFLEKGYVDYKRFEYHKLVGRYQRVFGRERVHVAAYEEFREAPDAFLANLHRFLGLDPIHIDTRKRVNRSHHPYTLFLDRVFNFLINNKHSTPLLGHWVREIPMPYPTRKGILIEPLHTWWRRFFVERFLDPFVMYPLFSNARLTVSDDGLHSAYAQSDRLLEEMTGLDLERYGYP